jgi:hypothetical protein
VPASEISQVRRSRCVLIPRGGSEVPSLRDLPDYVSLSTYAGRITGPDLEVSEKLRWLSSPPGSKKHSSRT